MKRINCKIWTIALMLVWLVTSCSEYLDVVPDNVITLDNVYGTKEDAYRALAKVYSYLPYDWDTHATTWNLGDEYIGRIDLPVQNSTDNLRAERIMRGLQSTSDPMLNFWSSRATHRENGARPLYEGLNVCNVFLEEIKKTRNLSETERKDWIAQVKFLKAYYHFLLVRCYGPIVIVDTNISADAVGDELFRYRDKVEDCFRFILDLLDEAIPDLPTNRPDVDLGMIEQVIAKCVKARILLYYASPFYSGNREFFEDFRDPRDNQPYFPVNDTQEQTNAKWNEALTAVDEAINAAKSEGKIMYQFPANKEYFTSPSQPYRDDRIFGSVAPERMKTLYDLRYVVVDPWNDELIWGMSNINYYDQGELAHSTNCRLSAASGITEGDRNQASWSWQWMGATYNMAERYYSKNGLPIDEDLTYNYIGRHDAFTAPGSEDPEYEEVIGLLQPGITTINLYANRELRFYANLDFTGGWVRSHFETIPVLMYQGTSGGYEPSVNQTDYYCTGIGLQKLVHPESRSSHWARTVTYPYPLFRMADLYLMKAEILNEIKDAPDQEVWDAINVVRQRAGIPNVETVWSNGALARTVNKHTTKSGMRDIILRERSIELAFEGHRFWDMQRHKRAHIEFASSIRGWNITGSSFNTFFDLGIVQARRFTIRDYLWPICLDELNTNGNLVQNPEW